MTAKEMFEKLGFVKESLEEGIEYLEFSYADNNIEFNNFMKEVYVRGVGINVAMLAAINKQVDELGWLDE